MLLNDNILPIAFQMAHRFLDEVKHAQSPYSDYCDCVDTFFCRFALVSAEIYMTWEES